MLYPITPLQYGTPIAVGIAQQLQLPAEAFILAVLFAQT